MTTINEFETAARTDEFTGKGNTFSAIAPDLFEDFRKVVSSLPKLNDSLADNFLVMARFGGGEKEISKADFKEKLGDQVTEFLNKIGCEKLAIDGDHLKLTLDAAKTIPIGDNGIKDVKLAKDIDMNISKNGDEIRVSGVSGIRVNPKYLPEFALPDFKITPKGIDLGTGIPYIPATGAYDQIDDLIKKLGK